MADLVFFSDTRPGKLVQRSACKRDVQVQVPPLRADVWKERGRRARGLTARNGSELHNEINNSQTTENGNHAFRQ